MSAPAARPHLRLEACCTLREVDDLHFSLLAADAGADPFLIDAAAVERVDTAGLQLLTAFVRQRATDGRSVQWCAVSGEFARGARRLGLEQLLGLPATAAGPGS